MPTDGADFRTNKICFGKAYSYAREGADGVVVAGAVMAGVERYIKFCGGAPAFVVVVDTLVTACRAGFGGERLLQALDEVQSKFAESPAPHRRPFDWRRRSCRARKLIASFCLF